jgi:hypothetical protein
MMLKRSWHVEAEHAEPNVPGGLRGGRPIVFGVTGIWGQDEEDRWRVLEPVGYPSEKSLQGLVEATPGLLPLAGSPRLAILGSEVWCGRERADLLAVEIDTGRLVVIEIKLASNVDRRQALTQVLGYAAYLRRLDHDGLDTLLSGSVENIVIEAAQDPAFNMDVFRDALSDSHRAGRVRCVLVLDAAPPELVELVSYLQDVTSDLLQLDLVTVSTYAVGDRSVLVPQLVDSDKTQDGPLPTGPGRSVNSSVITRDAGVFEGAICEAPKEAQGELRHLLEWAKQLERDGLAVLYSSTGKNRWVLNPRLPGSERGLLVVYNDRGPTINPWRTVWAEEAPHTLEILEAEFGAFGQGRTFPDRSDRALGLFRRGYEEAATRRRDPTITTVR